jgi:2-oxoglutarate ferredoxin oxidoreductase subunit beta
LIFNNRIYGLTKGQYSPRSELGKVTKSTPGGSADQPMDPASFALGVNAPSSRARSTPRPHHLSDVLRARRAHGTAFIEIYQNCNVFNDGAFDAFTEKPCAPSARCASSTASRCSSAPTRQGPAARPQDLQLEVVRLGENGITLDDVLVHDETNPRSRTC